MNKLSKEKREKLTLVLMGSLGLVAVIYLFVISAQKDQVRELAGKADGVRQKLQKAEFWARNAARIEEQLHTNRRDLRAHEEGMAPVDKYKWILNTLNEFLSGYDVSLVDITRVPEIGDVGVLPKFPYQAATFGVSFTAHFHEFGRFLADFENRHPYMRIKNLEMEPQSPAASVEGETNRSGAPAEDPEKLLIKLRVVTLIKPTTTL